MRSSSSESVTARSRRFHASSGSRTPRCIGGGTEDDFAKAGAEQASGVAPVLDADEQAELVRLRREVRRLETENEILKRAAAHFAKENVLPKHLSD